MSRMAIVTALMLAAAPLAAAQTPERYPADRLREVLPADAASRVLARIADARAHQLPATALEEHALQLAARGAAPGIVEDAVDDEARRMALAKAALDHARGRPALDEEVEAGGAALGKGVDGRQVSALAESAPSGRSLAVPLYVIASLVNRGLPSDQALARVQERLAARASDAELAGLPEQAAARESHRPASTGRNLAPGRSSAPGGGPPSGVPGNGGARTHPNVPSRGHGHP